MNNLIFLVILLLSLISINTQTVDLTLSISTNNIIRTLPDTFIGFNLDYWEDDHEHFGNSSIPYIDFTNKDLIALTSALQPAILRIGGSGEDSVIYNISNECNEPSKWNITGPYYCSEVHPPNYYCLTKTRWQQIFKFLDDTNTKLVYGLNACYGRKTNDEQMDITNIDSLLQYTASSYKILNLSRLYGFEFGNGMAANINSQMYSYDFIRMNTLINRYFSNVSSTIPLSIGTDNQYGDTQYVQNVLSKMPNDTMNILNYHQYTNCQQQKAYVFDKNCLEGITKYPPIYENILKNTSNIKSSLMIGESALDHSGGVNNASNVFLSSFYYTYQLSELAKVNDMNLVQRQTLSGGWYGLLNNSFVPMPDYWVLYLWKTFIGNKVLEASVTNNVNVTGYAYNGKKSTDVIVILINFNQKDIANVKLEFKGSSNSYKYNEYHMNGPLDSQIAYVNGKPLLYQNGQFPTLQSKNGNGNVVVQPATIVWIQCSSQ